MRIFTYILTVILATSILVPAFLGGLRTGFVVVALIAAGLLWSMTLWTTMPGALRVILIVCVSIPVFAIITGGFPGMDEDNLRRLSETLARENVRAETAIKVLRNTGAKELAAKVSTFSEAITRVMRKTPQ